MAAKPSTELTDVAPTFSLRAISRPCFLEYTDEDRPYLDLLASSTASSTEFTPVMVMVGPKVSSVTASEFSSTSTSTTGSMNGPLIESGPPSTALPPFCSASSMWRRTMSIWLGIVIGP
ncbi:Uncharacterised protein [Mycobacteroides abscessus subsp. abscessus]|nr:Uncharacterised protein [Mycobacteroides abscessus subsp. abscessus]